MPAAFRRRRFDEGAIGGVLITATGVALSAAFFTLGRLLRVVDDQLADIDLELD